MKAANRLGARFALIAGADELGRNCVSLRNMQDGTQTEVKFVNWQLAGTAGLKKGSIWKMSIIANSKKGAGAA